MELRMSAKERDRLDVMSRVSRRELSLMEASGELGLSYRQVKRVWQRFKAKGAAGLMHRARGRPSNNRTPDEVRDRIVKRHQERYADFGETLACEKLAKDKLPVHPDTLRSILKERGLHVPRRRRCKHRRRRERRAYFGSMVQMDGSHHDWFEGRAAKCVLMVLIEEPKLAEVLCRVEPRSVGNDWCVRWKNRWLQIEVDESCTPLAGKKVEVRELVGGDLLVSHQGHRLGWTALANRPRKHNLIVNNQRWRPGPGHPWVDQPACQNRRTK
jgi:transposase